MSNMDVVKSINIVKKGEYQKFVAEIYDILKSNFAVCLLSCSLVTIITIISSSIGNHMV